VALNAVLRWAGHQHLAGDVDIVGQLRSELADGTPEWHTDPDLGLDDPSRQLALLKSLLAQLNDPQFEEEIPLLLLRFTASFFSRGALLFVHTETRQIVGVGGYGLASPDPGRARPGRFTQRTGASVSP
jgi:hypothetical protein